MIQLFYTENKKFLQKDFYIHFTKMHGLGNDFIVINAIKRSFFFLKN